MSKIPPYNTQTVRDWINFQKRYDSVYQTIMNGAVRMTRRTRGIAGNTYYYGLDVPPGRQLIVYNRTIKLTSGSYDVDVVVSDDPGVFSGGTPALKTTLTNGADPTVTATLFAGVTPLGTLTNVVESLDEFGVQQGINRASGGLDDEGVLTVIKGRSVLRVRRADASGFDVAIRLIAWEEDIPE